MGAGTATVTATTTDGGLAATSTVTVIQRVTGITLNNKTLTIKPGGSDVQLTPTIAPSNATIKDITWTSSNPNVATVDSSGVVHAVAYGTAVIKATSTQDSTKYASCTVTVTAP